MSANNDSDEHGWDVDPEDESGAAVVAAVGRQLKAWREAAGMRAAEFGALIGYGEDLIYKVEGGRRIPRPEYLDRSDDVLGANGKIAMMKQDLAMVRYPKKVRDLASLEAKAVELTAYVAHGLHGLLQTPGHARALFEARQPPYSQDEVERMVAARMARQSIFERLPAPSLNFVQEESALMRPIGGRMEWRRQLERLLEVGDMRNVTLQVMPTHREAHPGMDGDINLLKFADGTAIGRSHGAFNGRRVTDARHLRIFDLRHGVIRAEALTPRETQALIQRVLGAT
ncbi:helix-turn-helix domain-containing protein [Streptomyces sp. NBC_01423]|uniref:helix-turn-helix domain-containing protein n=1 Tax=Streptomyces sp. NBC_01423 TaxID=2903860 RepID=UPI002E2C9CC6|nr:helix-turn-helix transcriptional regulator [Streptomyces sp. NBC_01423]